MKYIVMMHDKESDKHGQPLRIDCLADEKFTIEEIKEKIKAWPDKKAQPVLIEDPFMITVFDRLYKKGDLADEETKANEIKSALRNIIDDLQDLAY